MVYHEPVFLEYSKGNPPADKCPRCPCKTKRGTRCKLRTCNNQPCCWQHNQRVKTDIDNRLVDSHNKKRITKRSLKHYRVLSERMRKAECVIHMIYIRLHRLAIFSGINRAESNGKFKKHGKNMCFLAGAIPRVIGSASIRRVAVEQIMTLFKNRLDKYGDKDGEFSTEMLIACNWLNWAPGIKSASAVSTSLDILNPKDYSPMDIDNAKYDSCTRILLNYFLLSLTTAPDKRPPEYWFKEGLRVLGDRWEEIDVELKFYGARNFVEEDDQNMHMVYFVTHVIFMGNNYGNIPLRAAMALRNELFDVLRKWFYQIHELKAVESNMEIFFEICYSMFYLNFDRKFELPMEVWEYFDQMLDKGLSVDFSAAALNKKASTNIYFPNEKASTDRFLADYHTHVVMAFFFAEGVRYLSHQSITADFSFDAMDEGGNDVLESLCSEGIVVCNAEDTICAPKLTKQLKRIHKRHHVNNLLVSIGPDEPGSISVPESPTDDLLTDSHKLKLEPGFWKTLRSRIASCLGLTEERIRMFPNSSYARIKGGKGTTGEHSDFYHFIQSTNLLDLLYGVNYDRKTKLCVVCGNREGFCFDHICLCKQCANGTMPLYTAWISLGEYSNKKHTLLEFIPGSKDVDYSHIDDTRTINKQTPKGLRTNGKWAYGTPKGIGTCDMILFNCKVVHRANTVSHKAAPRYSLDIRFAILPADGAVA